MSPPQERGHYLLGNVPPYTVVTISFSVREPPLLSFCIIIIIVSISNGTADGGTFRGFFVQARQVSNDANRVGIFAPIGAESRLSSCAIDTVRFG